jgi:YidC/Oxa1 family membrane protein insertase
MDNLRTFLLIALMVTGYFLWEAWQRDYNRPLLPTDTPATAATADATATPVPPDDLPQAPAAAAADAPAAPAPAVVTSDAPTASVASAATQRIEVETDVLRVVIDTQGGSVVEARLTRYPIEPGKYDQLVQLLTDDAQAWYVAQAGLVSSGGEAPDHRAPYAAERTRYTLDEGQDELVVPLTWTSESGLTVTKSYRFNRGSYAIGVDHTVANRGEVPWSGSVYRQLQRTSPLVDRKFSFTNPEQYSFVGASWYSPEQRFEKLAFDAFQEDALNRSFTGGWAALQQHYFFTAWIPDANESTQYTTTVVEGQGAPRYLIRAMAPAKTVAPGATTTTTSRLYIGPKLQDHLEEIAPGLEYTVDYGMVTFIAAPLFWLLDLLHDLVGNWGVAIILLTLLVKAAFFKLTEAQYKSFAKMRKLTPRLQALKERYGDDRQKMNQAMMELYQKEKINPLGGCLPILVQIPVFIALYWVLLESVELRQAVFIPGWIDNISAKDPYFILPILNGVAMYLTQKLTPTTGMDPMQARVLQMMPVIFAVMFAFFPAGLVLYWTVNGVLGLAQQWYITRKIEAGDKA